MEKVKAFLNIINAYIGRKIRISFGFLIAVILFNVLYTWKTLHDGIGILKTISEDVNPELELISDFQTLVKDSKTYSINWVYISNYKKDKGNLKTIHNELYPQLKDSLLATIESSFELEKDTIEIQSIIDTFENILADQEEVMKNLSNASQYEDAMVVFIVEDLIESSIIPQTDALIELLDKVIQSKIEESDSLKAEMEDSFEDLKITIIVLGIIAILFALLISNLLAGSITKPLTILKEKIGEIQLGKIPEKIKVRAKDEVGQMSMGVNLLIDSFKSSSEFAKKIGNGELNASFEALSKDDVLGNALLSMRNNLNKVIEDTNEVVKIAGQEGKLDATITVGDKQGAWSDLAQTINDLLSSIATPILEVNHIVNAMAKGDLTVRYTSESQGDIEVLVNNLNKALNNLNELVKNIAKNATVVEESSVEMLGASVEMNSNTDEIASAISEMSSGAQNQVVKVDEASSLVEGILSSSNDMGQKAESINDAAKAGVERSEKGRSVVENMAVSMNEISTYSQETYESIKVLTQRSSEITRVLGVITDIASQTNLLALNAAIEAAQAGEAGRGFAVVAEEIRKLAEDSRSSASEIEKLVDDVQQDTKRAAQVMETMNASVVTGSNASIEASTAFEEITESNNRTLSLSEGILNATKNQGQDINQVVSITESVVVIAEQTAAGTEEIASSATELSSGMSNYNVKSEQLTKIAASLKTDAGKFKLLNEKV